MDEDLAMFIAIMFAMALAAYLIAMWIRHRRPPTAPDQGEATRQIETLSNENAGLKGQIGRLEERLSVLERIATDPSERTARAIEELR